MKQQQYTLPTNNVDNAFHPQNRDPYKVLETVTLYKGELVRPIRARFYRSTTGSTYWCSVWTFTTPRNGRRRYISGHGKATGGGYDKETAALDSALKSAQISGPEVTDKHQTLLDLTKALGYRGKTILTGV